jgi:hypothetical protein
VPAGSLTEDPISVDADSVEGTAAEGMVEGATVWRVKHKSGDCVSP